MNEFHKKPVSILSKTTVADSATLFTNQPM